MLKRILATSVLLITGCTPPSSPPTAETAVPEEPTPGTAVEATAQDTCNAARFIDLIGSNIDEVTVDQGPDVRVISPDSMVTQDFRPERLNIVVDADGQITSLECY